MSRSLFRLSLLLTVLVLVVSGRPAPREISISGRVTDAGTGAGLAGASLKFISDETGEEILSGILTDANGDYSATLGISVAVEEERPLPVGYSMEAPFPNPAGGGDRVVVPWSSPDAAGREPEMMIFDALGRRVSSGDRLAAGLYLINLVFPEGSIRLTSRFVISDPGAVEFVLRRSRSRSNKSGESSASAATARAGKSQFGASIGVEIVIEKTGYVTDAFQSRLEGSGSNRADLQMSRASSMLQTGPENVIGSADVSPSGTILAVTASTTPIHGLTIDVPAGAYAQSRSVSVSYSEVTSHGFGSDFNLLSPAIEIDMGDGYAEEAYEITVPIVRPTGHFAMAFMYDEATGAIEGMPATGLSDDVQLLPNSDPGYTTDIVRFSTRSLNRRRKVAAGKTGGIDLSFPVQILIASIPSDFLDNLGSIDSGFKPGVDNLEFPNYGSVIADGGQCSGQSITDMWYYLEKKIKLGEPALNSRYDRVSSLWQDNPRAYRLASVLQEDHDWSGLANRILATVETTRELQILSWYAFGYSIYLTGLPQYVGLTSAVGGHAIVAYKVVPSERALYVSDPNFPGEIKKILFDGSSFIPYGTKQNASQVSLTDYTGVGYYAVSSMVDWDHVSRRWLELEDDGIGRSGVNAFPAVVHSYKTSSGFTELTDNISVTSDSIVLELTCPTCQIAIANTGGRQQISVYNNSGDLLATSSNRGDGLAIVGLSEGLNELGIFAETWYDYIGDLGLPQTGTTWLDFRWVTIEKTTPNSGGSANATFQYTYNFAPYSDLDVNLGIDYATTLTGPGANLEFLGGDTIRARTDVSASNRLVISPTMVPGDSTIVDFVDSSGDRTRYAVSPLRLGTESEIQLSIQSFYFTATIDASTGAITIDYSTQASGDLFRLRIPLYVVVHEQQWLSNGFKFSDSAQEWQTEFLNVDGLSN